MRSPKDFFQPLAVGAPEPVREIPVRPSRMIHFFPASNEKMVGKVPDMAAKVDVLLANLEDGVPAADKEAARAGLVEVGKAWDPRAPSCGPGSTRSTRRGASTTSPPRSPRSATPSTSSCSPRSRGPRTSTTSTGSSPSSRPRPA